MVKEFHRIVMEKWQMTNGVSNAALISHSSKTPNGTSNLYSERNNDLYSNGDVLRNKNNFKSYNYSSSPEPYKSRPYSSGNLSGSSPTLLTPRSTPSPYLSTISPTPYCGRNSPSPYLSSPSPTSSFRSSPSPYSSSGFATSNYLTQSSKAYSCPVTPELRKDHAVRGVATYFGKHSPTPYSSRPSSAPLISNNDDEIKLKDFCNGFRETSRLNEEKSSLTSSSAKSYDQHISSYTQKISPTPYLRVRGPFSNVTNSLTYDNGQTDGEKSHHNRTRNFTLEDKQNEDKQFSNSCNDSSSSYKDGYLYENKIKIPSYSSSDLKKSIDLCISNNHTNHINNYTNLAEEGSKTTSNFSYNLGNSSSKKTYLPTRNGGAYDTKTLLGDDKYYYRKMKTILEAFPNDGPPLEATELTPYLYIGNMRNAEDSNFLQKYGITHVVNMAGTRSFDLNRSPYPKEIGVKKFLLIPAQDHDRYDMSKHFKKCLSFLDECKREKGIALVHCNLGINRSGCICALYLMHESKQTILQVMQYLKMKRSIVLCNKSFRKQLIYFARQQELLDIVTADNKIEIERPASATATISDQYDHHTESPSKLSHRRTKSDPLNMNAMGRFPSTSSLQPLHKTTSSSIQQNDETSQSMTRPLRMYDWSSQLHSMSELDELDGEDEDDNYQANLKSKALDTLYEEIEKMSKTSPYSSFKKNEPVCTATIAQHIPSDDKGLRKSASSSPCRLNKLEEDKEYLELPKARYGRSKFNPPSRSQSSISLKANSYER